MNFAIPEWLPYGHDAVNCECEALPDGVQMDMRLFGFTGGKRLELQSLMHRMGRALRTRHLGMGYKLVSTKSNGA